MKARSTALAAVAIALASAFFFTCTYVLNRAAATEGGYWAWTACLRYLITLPLLLPAGPSSLFAKLRDGRWGAKEIDLKPGGTVRLELDWRR